VKYWAPFVLIGDDVTIEFGEAEEKAETETRSSAVIGVVADGDAKPLAEANIEVQEQVTGAEK